MTMRAVFYTGRNQLEHRETVMPELTGPEEVVVKVKYAGICGTDLSIMAGKHPRARAPLIMGHEFSGEVYRSNSAREDLKEGAKVVVEPLITCGTCYACRSGYSYVCQNLKLYGIDAPGAFAEYVKIPSDRVFAIPADIPFDIAAHIEPAAVAVHAVRLSSLKVGDVVCVQGAGPIGLMTAIIARQAGPQEVIICEKEPFRVQMARRFGLTVIDVNTSDSVDEVNKITQGRGADIVFEVAGAPQTVLASPQLCRVRGEIIAVAIPKEPRPYDIVGLTFKELTVKGVRVYAPFDFERAIQIVARLGEDLAALITPPFALPDATAAFEKAAGGQGVMRVLFKIA